MKRWAVRSEYHNIALLAWSGYQPTIEYRYYRWRWLARLTVWFDNNLPNGVPFMTIRSTLLGRVRRKPKF